MDDLLEKIFSTEFEKEVLAWFFENKTEFGVSFFEAISFLGDWKLLFPFLLIIITILFLKGKHKLLVPLLVSVLGTESATLFLKDWFGRARPTFIPTEHLTASFPSAHSSIAIGFYGYLAYILIKFANPKHKALIAAIVSLIIILIGFSRVYLTVHYPSDVVVGYLVGLVFFAIAVVMSEAQFKEIEEEIEELEEEIDESLGGDKKNEKK